MTIDTELTAGSEGVLYSLGAYTGGVAVWIDEGQLHYEYNLYQVERTRVKTKTELPTGKVRIDVETRFQPGVRNGPADVVLRVNGKEVATGRIPRTTGFRLASNDSFDIGRDSYSPVASDYYDRAPFKFNGAIEGVHIKYSGEN